MAVNVENYGSQIGGEDPNATANSDWMAKFTSMIGTAFKDALKQHGNAAIAQGLKKTSKSEKSSTNTSNAIISEGFNENISEATKKYDSLTSSLDRLINNLSSGKQNLIEFNEIGNKLEVIASHFGLLTEASSETIKNFKETGVVTKELTSLMETFVQRTSTASEESSKLLSKNLEKSRKGTKEYLGELISRATATVGTLTAIFYPLISAGLEQQKQINELSRMTDDLLASNKNQEVFLKTTRDLSIAYGEDLKDVRGLFADVASDLGLSYKQITKGSKESYETVNEELKTYLDQALILKKTTDLEDKTLRGLYKTVKLVGINSKDAGGLVKVFTNSLAELRATNKFTKADVEEIAESIQDIVTNWGFSNSWGKDQIAAMTTQAKNLMLGMTEVGGEGGKEIGKSILKGLSTTEGMVGLMDMLRMNPQDMATAVAKQDLSPVLKALGTQTDKVNAAFDEIDKDTNMTDFGKLRQKESIIEAMFPGIKQKDAMEWLGRIKRLGGSLKAEEFFNLTKISPEANKKMLEMQDNLAGIMARLSGLYNKFMEVFGGPIVNLITPIVSVFATLATAILDVVNLLPEFVKGILGIGAGTVAAIGLGTAITNLLGFTSGATTGFMAMGNVLTKVGTIASSITALVAGAAWPVILIAGFLATLYALYKLFKAPINVEVGESGEMTTTQLPGKAMSPDDVSKMKGGGIDLGIGAWLGKLLKGELDIGPTMERAGSLYNKPLVESYPQTWHTRNEDGTWTKRIPESLTKTGGASDKKLRDYIVEVWKKISDFTVEPNDVNPIKSMWTTVTDWIYESVSTMWENLKKNMPNWAKKALGIELEAATIPQKEDIGTNLDHLAKQKMKEESNDLSTYTGKTTLDSIKEFFTNPLKYLDDNKNFTYKSGENLGNGLSYFNAFTQPSRLADPNSGVISPITGLSTPPPNYSAGIAPTVAVLSTMPEDVKELVKWLIIIANNTKEDTSKQSYNQYGYMPPTIDQRESMTRGQQPIVQGSQ